MYSRVSGQLYHAIEVDSYRAVLRYATNRGRINVFFFFFFFK